MWAIKVLNGPDAGRLHQLQSGAVTLGRSNQANIRVKSPSISKVHAKISVLEDKLIISDNRSSNGVIVNGVKIQNKILNPGDKFALGEVLFDVIELPNFVSIMPDVSTNPLVPVQHQGNLAVAPQEVALDFPQENNNAQLMASEIAQPEPEKPQLSFQEKVEHYIEEVALPGVYDYSSKFDLKYVVLSFVILFVVVVTGLSIFPVIHISRDFVVDESTRRADALAKILVQENRRFVLDNNEINVNVRAVRNEPGVEQAFIIDANDGHIVAPVKQRGRYAKIPFVQRARKINRRHREQFGNKIGVSHPILYTNPTTGEPSALAYAIVLYNLDKVALDIPRALSLMIQILLITMIAGAVIYFFLYKVITRPLYDLNNEINQALSEGENNIELSTPTPIFQTLVSNINSALSRMKQDESNDMSAGAGDKSMEASELVHMFPVAAIAIAPTNEMIMAHNDWINGHALFDDDAILDKYLEDLTDPSLVENLKDLIQKCADNPNQKHTNPLPASNGVNYEVSIKSIQEGADISYYIICFVEVYEDEGGYEE